MQILEAYLRNKTEYKESPLETMDDFAELVLHLPEDYVRPSTKAVERKQRSQTKRPRFNYVQSGKAHYGDPRILGEDCEAWEGLISTLAEHEYMLLNKLLRDDLPGLCLRGPAGSGKSTTLKYLLDTFIAQRDQGHCGKSGCDKRRLVITVNFIADVFKNIDSKDRAREVLLEEINKRVTEKLISISERDAGTSILLKNEDLGGFWDWSCRTLMTDPELGEKQTLMDLKGLLLSTRGEPAKLTRSERIRIRAMLRATPSKHLDYLLCLIHYVSVERRNPNRHCVYLVFDNLDYAHVFVQEELAEIVRTRLAPYHVKYVLALRTETFFRRKFFQVADEVIDHRGPRAAKLLRARVSAFLKDYPTAEALKENYPSLRSLSEAQLLPRHYCS